MNIVDIIKEAFTSLRINFKRTLLTVLGIVIGIFAVTIMLSLGEGIKVSIKNEIGAGSNGDIIIIPNSDSLRFHIDDISWLKQEQYTKGVLGIDSLSESISIFGKTFNSEILGVYGTYENQEIIRGKTFDRNNLELLEKVAVINSSLAKKISQKTKQDPLGILISIKGQKYKIIGISKEKTSSFAFNDGSIYIPIASLQRSITGKSGFGKISVFLKNQNHYDIVSTHVKESINASRNTALDNDTLVNVYSPQAELEQTKSIVNKFNLFLGLIGGISLLVGGIGTMNMMLTTISERTKEIGLRKAIGARDSDITYQILFESIFVTLIGGIIGVLFTILVAFIANKFIPDSMGFKLTISFFVAGIALLVSVFVGVIFGVSPARKAAKLQPADALRSD